MAECCPDGLECPCPPVGLVDVVGKKWAMCLVTLLGKHGAVRFGPIQRSLPSVSPATLTSTLRALQKERIIQRVTMESEGQRISAYSLTPRGETLYRSLLPLATWLRAT